MRWGRRTGVWLADAVNRALRPQTEVVPEQLSPDIVEGVLESDEAARERVREMFQLDEGNTVSSISRGIRAAMLTGPDPRSRLAASANLLMAARFHLSRGSLRVRESIRLLLSRALDVGILRRVQGAAPCLIIDRGAGTGNLLESIRSLAEHGSFGTGTNDPVAVYLAIEPDEARLSLLSEVHRDLESVAPGVIRLETRRFTTSQLSLSMERDELANELFENVLIVSSNELREHKAFPLADQWAQLNREIAKPFRCRNASSVVFLESVAPSRKGAFSRRTTKWISGCAIAAERAGVPILYPCPQPGQGCPRSAQESTRSLVIDPWPTACFCPAEDGRTMQLDLLLDGDLPLSRREYELNGEVVCRSP